MADLSDDPVLLWEVYLCLKCAACCSASLSLPSQKGPWASILLSLLGPPTPSHRLGFLAALKPTVRPQWTSMVGILARVSIAVVKHPDQKQLERRGFISPSSL